MAAAPQAPIRFGSLKGILLDMDGTLTNSDPLHFKAFQQVLVEAGFNGGQPITHELFREKISGRDNRKIAADLFPDASDDERVRFYVGKEERFRELAVSGELQRLDGLTAFLAWVDARGLRKAAVTNAPRANTELLLGALGLDHYFEAVVLGDECVRAKPFPDPYLEGLRLLGLKPEEALVVEDSPAGVQAAAAAGIPVIGVTTGQTPEALWAAGAQAVCRDFRDIMGMIESEAE